MIIIHKHKQNVNRDWYSRLCFLFFSDTMGNKGAFLTITGDDLTPKFTSFDAVVSIRIRRKRNCNKITYVKELTSPCTKQILVEKYL